MIFKDYVSTMKLSELDHHTSCKKNQHPSVMFENLKIDFYFVIFCLPPLYGWFLQKFLILSATNLSPVFTLSGLCDDGESTNQ